MSNLRDIKKRINNISIIEKTTQSMRAISASKLAFVKNMLLVNKSYFDASKFSSEILIKLYYERNIDSLYFKGTSIGKKVVIFVTADTGLCGAYNSNVLKKVSKEIEQNNEVILVPIGNKAHLFVKKLPKNIEIMSTYLSSDIKKFNLSILSILLKNLLDLFDNKCVSEILLMSSKNIAIMEQEVIHTTLLPINPVQVLHDLDHNQEIKFKENLVTDYYLNHSFANIVLDYLKTSIYRKIIDAVIAEHSCRLNAMDNAYNNSKDIKGKLKLEYNRVRQDLITKELIEIISGAEVV